MDEKQVDKVFKAIADSKRRAIIKMLVLASASLNINDISAQFDESRQAITKHIKTLESSGLVTIEKQGRDRYLKANPQVLFEVHQWVMFYQKFWTNKLDDLEDYLDMTKEEGQE